MDPRPLQRIAGWSAFINTFVGISSFTALMLFFAVGGFWGPVNDALSVIWALSLVPLAGWFLLGYRTAYPLLKFMTTVMGMAAMLLFAILQFLLVVGLVRYEQTLAAILTLTGAIGLWQISIALMVRSEQNFPSGLVWVMLASGAGLLLSAIGFWLGGTEHPLTAVGFLAGAVAGFAWAFWLARLLTSGQVLAFH